MVNLTIFSQFKLLIMSRKTLKNWAKEQGFNLASPVRANTNAFLYITLINTERIDEAQNIYLAKSFVERSDPKVGDRLNTSEVFMSFVEYTDGRPSQWKITDKEGDGTATLIANGYEAI
jgi:hypothetical protein